MFLVPIHFPHQLFLHSQVSFPVDKAFSMRKLAWGHLFIPSDVSPLPSDRVAHLYPACKLSGTGEPSWNAETASFTQSSVPLKHPNSSSPHYLTEHLLKHLHLCPWSFSLCAEPEDSTQDRCCSLPPYRAKVFNQKLVTVDQWVGLGGREALSYHRKWTRQRMLYLSKFHLWRMWHVVERNTFKHHLE